MSSRSTFWKEGRSRAKKKLSNIKEPVNSQSVIDLRDLDSASTSLPPFLPSCFLPNHQHRDHLSPSPFAMPLKLPLSTPVIAVHTAPKVVSTFFHHFSEARSRHRTARKKAKAKAALIAESGDQGFEGSIREVKYGDGEGWETPEKVSRASERRDREGSSSGRTPLLSPPFLRPHPALKQLSWS